MTHVWLHSLEPGFESHLSSIGDQLADRLGSSNHSVSKWIPFSSERTHRDEHQSILLLVGDWKNFSRSDYFVAANALALHESGVVLLLPVIIARPEITRKGDEVWLERYSALWQRLHKLAILTPQSDELNLNELVAKVSDAHLAHSNNARKTQTLPATLFFSYCHRDQGLRDELAHHLKLLERVGLIEGWHDRKIAAGEEWSAAIDAHLYTADLILLLLSSDFFASDYCSEIEAPIALERHKANAAKTIPIVLRPVMWRQSPLAALQALPTDARPVTSWDSTDSAFVNVCEGIVSSLLASKTSALTARQDSAPRFSTRHRVLDAALPSHVEPGRSEMLVVLIRKPTSPGLHRLLAEEPEYGIEPEDVRSKPARLQFPIGPTHEPESIAIRVRVSAPDFDPPQQTRTLTLRPDEDSQPIIFMFAARLPGRVKALVSLYNGELLVASCALSTLANARGAMAPLNIDSTTFAIEVLQPGPVPLTQEEQSYLDTVRESLFNKAFTRATSLIAQGDPTSAEPILVDLQRTYPSNVEVACLLQHIERLTRRRFAEPDPAMEEASEAEAASEEPPPPSFPPPQIHSGEFQRIQNMKDGNAQRGPGPLPGVHPRVLKVSNGKAQAAPYPAWLLMDLLRIEEDAEREGKYDELLELWERAARIDPRWIYNRDQIRKLKEKADKVEALTEEVRGSRAELRKQASSTEVFNSLSNKTDQAESAFPPFPAAPPPPTSPPTEPGSFTQLFSSAPALSSPDANETEAFPPLPESDRAGGGLTQLLRTLDSPSTVPLPKMPWTPSMGAPPAPGQKVLPASESGATTTSRMPDLPSQGPAAADSTAAPGEFTRIIQASAFRESALPEDKSKRAIANASVMQAMAEARQAVLAREVPRALNILRKASPGVEFVEPAIQTDWKRLADEVTKFSEAKRGAKESVAVVQSNRPGANFLLLFIVTVALVVGILLAVMSWMKR